MDIWPSLCNGVVVMLGVRKQMQRRAALEQAHIMPALALALLQEVWQA